MAALTKEEREKLVRTAVWTGIGMGFGVAIGNMVFSLAKTALHSAGVILQAL